MLAEILTAELFKNTNSDLFRLLHACEKVSGFHTAFLKPVMVKLTALNQTEPCIAAEAL